MGIEESIANLEDVVRIRKLEDEGKLGKGMTDFAIAHSLAYVQRIMMLRFVFSLIPYPGPTVTENEPKRTEG